MVSATFLESQRNRPLNHFRNGLLAEFSLFVVGKVDKSKIKVKLEREAPKGEKYRISWPKTLEIDGTALALKASDNTDPVPFFDYVTEFVKVVKAHEKLKAAQKAPIT